MGCPSAAIAVEELANIGVKCVVRIGSTGAMQEGIAIGDLIINHATMKGDGTCRYYVPDTFPAVADLDLTNELIGTAREMLAGGDIRLHLGINASDDAFYTPPAHLQKLMDIGITNVDMESSAIFTVCHKRRLRAACICGVSSNLATGEVIYTRKNEKLAQAWEKEIQIVLETIYRFEQGQTGQCRPNGQ